jgi:hypothetical protein
MGFADKQAIRYIYRLNQNVWKIQKTKSNVNRIKKTISICETAVHGNPFDLQTHPEKHWRKK